MLETLSRGFRSARNRLRGFQELTERNIDDAVREIRLTLLEADVEYNVAKRFLERVKEKALGEIVQVKAKAKTEAVKVTPGAHFVKICQDELEALMGPVDTSIVRNERGFAVILMVGLQGSGKTTTAAKLSHRLKEAGNKPYLVAADVYRPAAIEQLRLLGQRVDVPVFNEPGLAPPELALKGMSIAGQSGYDTVIIDTAGRLAIDDVLMAELEKIRAVTHSKNIFLVVDAMIGQDAVATAEAFGAGVGFTGVVLTKLDGDARGGAALSVREVTGVPILFASTGEKLEDFDVFHPDRMASRILGMGDVLSLIEQAEQVFDAQKAEEAAAKIGSGELTLEDFLEQMLAIRKMGPIGNLLGMLPGAGQMKDALAAVDDKHLDRVQAIIRGMTPEERADPKIINASRRLRIANGSGVAVSEVNQLVDRFFEARKMMSQMAGAMGMPFARRSSKRSKGKQKKGKKGARPRNPLLGSGLPGGMPDLSQMPPGLNELPPGLADFDLSKLKFPGKN